MDRLIGHLGRVLGGTGACAAVIWERDGDADTGAVVYAAPGEILPQGMAWPRIEHSEAGVIQRDPGVVGSLVPTSLRLAMPAAPTAAASMPLADPDLSLLLVWCDPAAAGELPRDVSRLIAEEIAYDARMIRSERRAEHQARHLRAVLDTLGQGVASVDHNRGLADVNPAAAALLDLPMGKVPAAAFAAAMRNLFGRALNQPEIAALGGLLLGGSQARVDCLVRLADAPRRLKVSSHSFEQGLSNARVWIFEDVSAVTEALEAVEVSNDLLRASSDSMLDPQVLFEAVRDGAGEVVDFRYLDVNRAACAYLKVRKDELLGTSALDSLPDLEGSGLLARYARCLSDGEPVILTDFSYFNEMLDDARRYDIRATRAGPDLLCLSWSDVTDRYHAARTLAASELKYRLLADNSGDTITHVRDGRFAWVSPAAESLLGAPAEHWIGREVREIIPPADAGDFAERMATLATGATIQRRIRVVSVDGVTHWVHLHAKPFHGADGHRDGYTGSLRPVDGEVAAELQAAEAREQQARADALYRRSIDNSAVGMCLCDLEGNFFEVNEALCRFFGYDADSLRTKTWQELTAPDYLAADLDNRAQILAGEVESYRMVKQFLHADGHSIWGDLAVSCIRDADGEVETFIGQITDITDEVETRALLEEARRRQAEADALYRRSMDSAAAGMAVTRPDGSFVEVNAAICDFFGFDSETMLKQDWMDLTAPEFREPTRQLLDGLMTGRTETYRMVKQYIHADGHRVWGDLSVGCLRDADGNVQTLVSQIVDVTAEMATRAELEDARRLQARADVLYRRSVDGSAIGMALHNASGDFIEVNTAMCEFFGYDAEALLAKTWQDLTAPGFLAVDVSNVEQMWAGRLDSYRRVKQFIHADGHLIWGDLAVSCIRDVEGRVEQFISQIADVTEAVEVNERNVALTERLTAELQSAASYMASIMPRGLAGQVTVSSRYLPSRELGGDCFDYGWIDDDHLMVYLIDVSGHGIEPALLAVSLQNLLRSGTLGLETMLDPAAVLAELNRLFTMEQQGGHYFTMWFGIYEASTRTLRYASAGTPPAYAFAAGAGGAVSATELVTRVAPVGTFSDTEFVADTFDVPAGCRILIFSDGASELPLAGGGQMSLPQFRTLVTRQAGSPHWTLDDLIDELRDLSEGGVFEDDLSLIRLAFD